MYVYFILAEGRPRRMKIGKAKNPAERLRSLQTGSPHRLSLHGFIKCKDDKTAYAIEKMLHEKFATERKNGEWFRCTDYLMARVMDLECSSPS